MLISGTQVTRSEQQVLYQLSPVFVLWNKISLCGPGWPRTHGTPAAASQTVPGLFLNNNVISWKLDNNPTLVHPTQNPTWWSSQKGGLVGWLPHISLGTYCISVPRCFREMFWRAEGMAGTGCKAAAAPTSPTGVFTGHRNSSSSASSCSREPKTGSQDWCELAYLVGMT